ncbi:hypothetical protein PZA11_004790 [Diplocarpon coronariae]
MENEVQWTIGSPARGYALDSPVSAAPDSRPQARVPGPRRARGPTGLPKTAPRMFCTERPALGISAGVRLGSRASAFLGSWGHGGEGDERRRRCARSPGGGSNAQATRPSVDAGLNGGLCFLEPGLVRKCARAGGMLPHERLQVSGSDSAPVAGTTISAGAAGDVRLKASVAVAVAVVVSVSVSVSVSLLSPGAARWPRVPDPGRSGQHSTLLAPTGIVDRPEGRVRARVHARVHVRVRFAAAGLARGALCSVSQRRGFPSACQLTGGITSWLLSGLPGRNTSGRRPTR